MTPTRTAAVAALLAFASGSPAADPPAVADALKAITAVAKEGAGNPAAAVAWKAVVAAGGDALVPTLTAFDAATPTAANWLRSAVDAIAENEAKAGRKLPPGVWAFITDTKRNPAARRIAFELARAEDKPAAEKLLPGLINDPSLELRRDAIAARLEASKTITSIPLQRETYAELFAAARDKDQVEAIAALLEKGFDGVGPKKPDLTRHFGYVTEWQVVGPFDSPKGAGFAKAFPPETGVDLAAKYPGKADANLTWKAVQSPDVYGKIDLNAELGKHMDAVAYAAAVVVSEKETPAEIRAASQNAVRIFLNGKRLLQREEYHHGTRMDQHVARGTLKAGRNEILVKVCQNNQTEKWAQAWDFAVRVCDATGGALPLKQEIIRDGKPATVTPGAVRETSTKKEGK